MSKWPYATKAWRDLRRAKLSAKPVCEACEKRGVVVLAKAVDHVVAINKGGEPFPPLTGLMALCEPCHNAKTNAVDHPNASGFRRALKGFDAEGNPIDPEGWTAPAARPVSDSGKPGGFAGRRSAGIRPAGSTQKDLVSCEETKWA